MNRFVVVAMLVVSMSVAAEASSKKKHQPNPPTAVVTIFGGQYLMTRPGCDISKNGTAWLDACAPDGMAAATGDSRRKGRNR